MIEQACNISKSLPRNATRYQKERNKLGLLALSNCSEKTLLQSRFSFYLLF